MKNLFLAVKYSRTKDIDQKSNQDICDKSVNCDFQAVQEIFGEIEFFCEIG